MRGSTAHPNKKWSTTSAGEPSGSSPDTLYGTGPTVMSLLGDTLADLPIISTVLPCSFQESALWQEQIRNYTTRVFPFL